MRMKTYVLSAVVLLALTVNIAAQQQQARPAQAPKTVSLIFHETFKGRAPGAPAQIPLTTGHATNANLELKLYGPGAKAAPDHESGLLLNNAADEAKPDEMISYIWSGVTEGHWAVMLREKNNLMDLTGPAKLRWRLRPRSFHQLRPVVKLADGTMLAADYAEAGSTYWRETEVYFVDIPRWRVLEPNRLDEARDTAWRYNLDLSKVDEIGFTDLQRGAGHGAEGNSGLDWIEVHGKPVPRATSQSQR